MTITRKSTKAAAIVLTLAMLVGMFCVFGTASASAATDRVSLYSSGITFSKYGFSTSEIFIKTNDNALVAGCKNTVIPEDVVSIVEGAFANNAQLKKIVIPATVTAIGNGAFNTCGLTSVVCKSATPPATIVTSTFQNVSVRQCELHIPMGAKQAYIDAGWTETIFKGGIIEESEYDLNKDGSVDVMDVQRVLNEVH